MNNYIRILQNHMIINKIQLNYYNFICIFNNLSHISGSKSCHFKRLLNNSNILNQHRYGCNSYNSSILVFYSKSRTQIFFPLNALNGQYTLKELFQSIIFPF